MIEIDITFKGIDEETLVSREDEMNVVACTFDALGNYWFIGQNRLRYTDMGQFCNFWIAKSTK